MIGLRLDPDLEQRVRRIAREHGRSASDVVREAIRRFLDQTGDDLERERELRLIAASVDDGEMDELEAFAAELQGDEEAAAGRHRAA
ncbi:ribbon-helix-helix protein, CopG family [Sphingomonas lenta]|uniref:CopG family transcriptional regulator n=1 Tax=Sphingomonas lenta TaxID=1141887 RepID=A0A2A2SJ96_9SPHN|nr:ribbon-helix-helix protein, CopG family [Sphingomonas lenta]PAX09303.1 CopG family transcriptional regulator [Sphingomonas lenta]